jgi:threonine dehydratase
MNNKYYNILSKIKPFIKSTKLEELGENLYIKKESDQWTNSFKWSGVFYSVLCEFEKIKKATTWDNILEWGENRDYYFVTQSTGNHAIALINAVNECINLYSEHINTEKIYVYIFGNKKILKKKLDILKKLKNDKVMIDINYENYELSLNARKDFLKKNKGVYMEHGGENIINGYVVLGLLINEQIDKINPNIKSVGFYAAVGSGGPVGIAKGIKIKREVKMISCQTIEFNAFNKSIRQKKICKNEMDQDVGISEGIAVNEPEKYAFELGKEIVFKTIDINTEEVEKNNLNNNYSNSTNISLSGYKKYKTDCDINIILDCEL